MRIRLSVVTNTAKNRTSHGIGSELIRECSDLDVIFSPIQCPLRWTPYLLNDDGIVNTKWIGFHSVALLNVGQIVNRSRWSIGRIRYSFNLNRIHKRRTCVHVGSTEHSYKRECTETSTEIHCFCCKLTELSHDEKKELVWCGAYTNGTIRSWVTLKTCYSESFEFLLNDGG